MSSAITSKESVSSWSPFVKIYDPLKAGSIDGTDLIPHDNAVIRAICAEYSVPVCASNASQTLFVGRLNLKTSERQLHEEFSKFGQLKSCRIVKDIVTGISRGYGFVEYKKEADAQKAWRLAHSTTFHERQILVEWEFARTLPGWIPRRLGGGLGGKKESGQLRFGGRDRPFKRPLILPLDEEQHLTTPDSRLQDRFTDVEEDFNRAKTKPSRNDHNTRYFPGNYCNEGNRHYKRFSEDKFSKQYNYSEDRRRCRTQIEEKYSDQSCYEEERRKFCKYLDGHFSDEPSHYDDGRKKYRKYTEENYADQSYLEEGRQKYQRHTGKKYSDQYCFEEESKKYKSSREDNYIDKSKYGKDYTSSNDKSYRKEYDKRSNKSDHHQRDFGSSSYHEAEKKQSKKNRQYEQEGSKHDTLLMNIRELAPTTSRDGDQFDFERTKHETGWKKKRKHSSSADSSSSHLSNITKKPKKRKHKKKNHHSDSSESSIDLESESTKKHKKKKKKKSKRK